MFGPSVRYQNSKTYFNWPGAVIPWQALMSESDFTSNAFTLSQQATQPTHPGTHHTSQGVEEQLEVGQVAQAAVNPRVEGLAARADDRAPAKLGWG